jgi:hypothetical protein
MTAPSSARALERWYQGQVRVLFTHIHPVTPIPRVTPSVAKELISCGCSLVCALGTRCHSCDVELTIYAHDHPQLPTDAYIGSDVLEGGKQGSVALCRTCAFDVDKAAERAKRKRYGRKGNFI